MRHLFDWSDAGDSNRLRPPAHRFEWIDGVGARIPMILPSGCFDFNRFDDMTLSEIEYYVPRRYGSLFPEYVGKEGSFDWIGFEESFPEEMAQLAMRMKGFMSGYHTYRLRGGAYRLSHSKLVALFEWVHQDFMDEVLSLMRTQQLNVLAEAGCIMPDSLLCGSRSWRWAEFEWRDMAVELSAALLLEVVWRKSILSETLLQMMPPPIVMVSRELHDLHGLDTSSRPAYAELGTSSRPAHAEAGTSSTTVQSFDTKPGSLPVGLQPVNDYDKTVYAGTAVQSVDTKPGSPPVGLQPVNDYDKTDSLRWHSSSVS